MKTTFSIRANQGGRLITARSLENVGVGNYVVKTNWRRIEDREFLREGHLLFRPNASLPQGSQHLNLGPSDVIDLWELVRPNGDRALVAATKTTLYRFNYSTGVWDTIGSGFSSDTTHWQGESMDGYLILNNQEDLPVTFRVEESSVVPIYELRYRGVAKVGHISVFNGLLICSDVTEIKDSELAGVLLSGDPFGRISNSLTNRVSYRNVWSDFGDPRNWAPVVTGTITSADKDKITLAYPAPHAFPVGSKLAVSGAGPNGGVLGGQVGIEDGVVVTDVAGSVLTISVPADSGLTFPLTVSVTRFADTSTFVGRADIKDDSSRILAVKPLKTLVVVYRTTGIWLGRYTGVASAPLVFKPAYYGAIVPAYPRAIVDVEGDYHVFPTAANFYAFDGSGAPRLMEAIDDAGSLFFSGLTPSVQYRPFATINKITNELWFHSVNGVLAYDLATATSSWIDAAYTAATYSMKPGGGDYWQVLALGGQVLQYGALHSGPVTYKRNGVPVTHVVEHGELSMNDDENEKDLLSYMPLFSRVQAPVTVKLYGRDNIAAESELILDYELEDPVNSPLVETFYRNVYFRDRVEYVSEADDPVTFVGSAFTLKGVSSAGGARNGYGL